MQAEAVAAEETEAETEPQKHEKKLLHLEFNFKRQSIGASGNESHWHSVKEALLLLPECSGTFRLGLGSDTIPGMGTVQTVYISHTTERKTLREVVSQVLFGWEGSSRLAMMVVNPRNRAHLVCKWTESVYPEDLIEDEVEQHIIGP
ncbi:uncharacterized protein LOC134857254 [Symsagittifera roscoffensis]|uniref:uncharacterized protein LOC134857254 n=1 Tax=Symsagittifera roscoffensis TaxID=84072 RepID=UPI00307B2F67